MTSKSTFRTLPPISWNPWMLNVELFQSHDNNAIETMHAYQRFDLCYANDLQKIMYNMFLKGYPLEAKTTPKN